MKKKIVPVLVVLALIVVGAGGYFMGQQSNNPAIETSQTENSTPDATPITTTTPEPTPESEEKPTEEVQDSFFDHVGIYYATQATILNEHTKVGSRSLGVINCGDEVLVIGVGNGQYEGWFQVLLANDPSKGGFVESKYFLPCEDVEA